MSFLSSLFRSRNRSRGAQSRNWLTVGRVGSRSNRGALTRAGQVFHAPPERLEPRLALSVTTMGRDLFSELGFPTNAVGSTSPVGDQPGQLVIAADQGSDVYLQKIDMTPEELLVADNGSFLDYMAIENVDTRFDELIVTNGAEHQYNESITADSWWLFPTQTNDNAVSPTEGLLSTANLTTTRLALDRPEVRIGPGRDFFGKVSYLQSDGTLTSWTYSAWDGSGNVDTDYVTEFGESLYVTSGPGFGGGPYSFKNTLIAPVAGLPAGYVFPRKISVITEQLPENLQTGPGDTKQFGGRRHYLAVEWSQEPVLPPVMEANYWGASHYNAQGVPQNVRDPFSTVEDVPPTVGVAMRTTGLRVTVPRAVTEGSSDGAPTLGIIPGTTSGELVIGGAGQEEVYRVSFEDRKNSFRDSDAANDRYTFFFNDYDNSGAISAVRQFGLIEGEIETNIVKDIDWRFREQAVQTHTYLEGELENASTLLFGIGSHVNDQTDDLDLLNNLYGDNSLNDAFRAMEGVNVIISEQNLLDGTAREAVRVENLDYHVYVKPTVANEVYFVAGADFTRSVTVDLLKEGSSVYVNSPIRVANPIGDIDLRATNVLVNAPLETNDYLILGRSNSEQSPRLPRVSDPQGGELSTPTFLGSLLPDEATTRTVVPTPVLEGNSVESLEVLPGREGYGYDPVNPPTVTIEPAEVLEASVAVVQVSGGVSELILEDTGGPFTGEGVADLEFLDVTIGAPDLRVVDSVNRWTLINEGNGNDPQGAPAPAGYRAAPAIAISPPEITSSVTRIGYGEPARVQADMQWGNGVGAVRLVSGGQNYSARPTITLKLKNEFVGVRDFWDRRIPVEFRSFPVFTYQFDLVLEDIMSGGQNPTKTGSRYVSGTVAGLSLLSTGFGLNVSSSQDLVDYYEFEVTGGYNPNLKDGQFDVQGVPDVTEIVHAIVRIDDAVLGTLAWKGASKNDNVNSFIVADPNDSRFNLNDPDVRAEVSLLSDLLNPSSTQGGAAETRDQYERGIIGSGQYDYVDALLDAGTNYELAPDVQFIGRVTAIVPREFRVDEDFDGDDGVDDQGVLYGDPVIVSGGGDSVDGKSFYRASLEGLQAYADGTDETALPKGKFRDVDYLSLLNGTMLNSKVTSPDPDTGEDKEFQRQMVTARASVDGENWFRVVPVAADTLENFYWPASGSEGDRQITLAEGFTDWQYIQKGMQIELPSGQKVKIVQWFESSRKITVDQSLEVDLQETQFVPADRVPGLADDEQPEGVRFGPDRNIVDEYRQQFAFRKVDYDNDDAYWWAFAGRNVSFDRAIDADMGLVSDARIDTYSEADIQFFEIYYDPWFEEGYYEQLEPDAPRSVFDPANLDLFDADGNPYRTGVVTAAIGGFASLGFDPAQGRAALSPVGVDEDGNVIKIITTVEVTHPGSGYIRTPTVAIPNGAQARAIVEGGIFEINVEEPGFNYYGDTLPGLAAEVIRSVTIPVFDETNIPVGGRQPKADLLARNTSIRGGQISDPGAGLKIIGPAGSGELAGFQNEGLTLEPGQSPAIDAAVFQAVVESDGRILRFEKLRGGSGYRIAPVASVDSPEPPRSASAISRINSSTGRVTQIDIVEEGYRYAVPPKVYVMPPTPRGEGRAAQAVAVLGPSGEVIRINVTDSGSGYTAPPVVQIQTVDAYNVVENVDLAARVSANKYEWYVSRNVWTDRERGSILLRPNNPMGLNGGTAQWMYIEAAATDIVFESDVNATDVTVLMNSRVTDQSFAPYTFTTESTATGEQSGKILADQLVLTMGNDVPTPLSGGSLENRVSLRTDVRTVRATAAVSARNPRGAFPYDLRIEAIDDLNIEAVPRSTGKIDLFVPGDLDVKAGIITDGDISIETTTFQQTTPLITGYGEITIKAQDINVLNSVIVRAAPLDDRKADISLHATAGNINLAGAVSSPNGVYLRQEAKRREDGGVFTDPETGLPDWGSVGGNTRVNSQRLLVEAEGDVNVFTDVNEARASIDFGDFTLNELNDITIPTLQVPDGVVRLTANGVDRGGDAINPIALTARIVEGRELFVSTPHGSMDIDVDTSSALALGVLDELSAGAAPMLAAGSVRIVNASGSVNVYDGPIAGQAASIVRAASTGRLPDVHSYEGNTPGEFPSELSGPGRFPSEVFGGLDSPLRVGDVILVKDQFDRPETDRFDESRENGVYKIVRLGGGDAGYADWLIRRTVQADERGDLLPGSYVRVREGDLRGNIYQVQYSVLPSMSVTRTSNNQLVIGAGVGGLLGLDLNDVVTGDGILPGARVTGVDFEHGVVTLGVGNGYTVSEPDPVLRTVTIAAGQSLLFEALEAAERREEQVLISGDWFTVGAVVEDWDPAAGKLTIAAGGIRTDASGESTALIGFTEISTDRVSLNPAARTFLLSSVADEAAYGVATTRTISGEADGFGNRDYVRVETTPGRFLRNSIDVLVSSLDGWPVRVGDEVTYSVTDSNGRTIDYIDRVVSVLRGTDDSQDDIPTTIVRLGLAENVLTPTFVPSDPPGGSGTYELPELTFRSRARVVPTDPVDWDSLHVGMEVGAGNAYIPTTVLSGAGISQANGSYRYVVADGEFASFARLRAGFSVTGEGVAAGTELVAFDASSGTVDLSKRLLRPQATVTFGKSLPTLVDWSEDENYLLLSDELETSDFSVELSYGFDDFTIGDSVTVDDPGSGYTESVSTIIPVRFSEPELPENEGGKRMEGYAIPDGEGGIARIEITTQGLGYDAPPVIVIAPPVAGGVTATATVNFNRGSRYDIPESDKGTLGFFEYQTIVNVTTSGDGYTKNVDIEIPAFFSAPDRPLSEGAVQMLGYAVPDGAGGIDKIVVTQPGFGYAAAPSVTIASPLAVGSDTGTQAVAESVYVEGDKVLVSFGSPDAADGVPMRGHAIPDGRGGIEQVVIVEQGRGYTSGPPSVTIAAPESGGSQAQVELVGGVGYTTDESYRIGVRFSPPDTASGIQMEGYAIPDGAGGIERVVITRQGRGYAKTPTVTIDPPVNQSRTMARARAIGHVTFAPEYQDEVNLRNLLGGDDSSISLTSNFTNYDGLREGQSVFGDGVLPGTVITRVLPALRRVEVTPGGLPVRTTVTDGGMNVVPGGSQYYTDGFDIALNMPETFNEFHNLRVGQRVRFPQGGWADSVITAIDPVYRQIGLRPPTDSVLDQLTGGAGAAGGPIAITEVVFDSLDRVEFGMISSTGAGQAAFSVTPFGYEAMTITTQAVASGLVAIHQADVDNGRYEVELQAISDEQAVIAGRMISGVGFNPGYRIEQYEGKVVRLYSAEITRTVVQPDQSVVYSLGADFHAYSSLRNGMRVTGELLDPNLTVTIREVNQADRTVTLEGVPQNFAGGKVVFGNPFTSKWLSLGVGEANKARSGLTIHRGAPVVQTLIAADNVRDRVTYEVSTEGGTSLSAGALSRFISLAQQNEYHYDATHPQYDQAASWGGAGVQPSIGFRSGVTTIELEEPLPTIRSNAVEIDGGYVVDGVLNQVEVNGRFIDRTIAGDAVLSTTIVNGIVVEGEQASGTVVRDLRLGGFNNGAAFRVDDADGVLLADSMIGRTAAGVRAGSQFGVLITGGAENTTILNSEILSADQAGVRVEGGAAGAKLTGVTIGRDYGTVFNPRVFWSETGVEVAADSIQLGVEAVGWKVLAANGSGVPNAYSAELVNGSDVITLSMSSDRWQQLEIGLAVIGFGLPASTFIESIDVANQQVKISKPATRTTTSQILIGHQAVGVAGGSEVTLNDSVDLDRLFLGQTVRVVSGTTYSKVFETTITNIDSNAGGNGGVKLGLAGSLPHAGLYEQSIRLIEFGEPVVNTIQYSRNGVVVGVFGNASAESSGAANPKLVLTQEFTGWESLVAGMKFKVRTSSDGAGTPTFLEGTVVEWNRNAREISFEPLASQGPWPAFQNRPVVFDAANQFAMVSTTISESIENGLVFGGGVGHQIGGAAVAVRAFGSSGEAKDALVEGEEAVELASYGVPASLDGVGGLRITDAAAADWLAGELLNREINLYGTNLPERARVKSFDAATGYLEVEVVDESGNSVNSPNFLASSSGTVYFGLGVFVNAEPALVRVGDAVDGEGIFEFLAVDAYRKPFTGSDATEHRGYLAFTTPLAGLPGGRFPEAGDVFQLVNRRGSANVIKDNSGYGISLIDTVSGPGGGVAGSLYSDLYESWRLIGNYIDLSYDTSTVRWVRSPNFEGPVHPSLFAQLFSDGQPFSDYDRTDDLGNQYGEQVLPRAGDTGSGGTGDDPFGDGSSGGGSGSTDDGDGSGSDPNTGYRPGVPF